MFKRLSLAFLALMLMATPVLTGCASSGDDDDAKTEKAKADKEAKEAKAEKKKREQEIPICPQVAILRELQQFNDYGTEKPDPGQLVAQAKMVSVDGDCGYVKTGVDIKFDLSLVAAKGPRLGGQRISFPFFIAVVAPDGTILSKEKMTTEINFSGHRTADTAESLHVMIPFPMAQRKLGADYRVLLGFQLNEDQLAEARKTMVFTGDQPADAGKDKSGN
jgi:hypothetical protein